MYGCVYAYIQVCNYMSTYVFMNVINVGQCKYVCICMYVFMSVCMFLCMYV